MGKGIGFGSTLLTILVITVFTAFGASRPAGSGGVKVFDGNGQFLGVLLGTQNGVADIYISSLSGSVHISFVTGDAEETYLSFESRDCTGQPYVSGSVSYTIVKSGGAYYIGELVAPVNVQISSIFENGKCQLANQLSRGVVPAARITHLPFTLPAALPLRFE